MEAKERYQRWLADAQIDDETKQELQALAAQDDEIYDRFFKVLEFGTGGMRGKIGAGSNRMNLYTIRLAAQALATALKEAELDRRGVAIAHDSRRMSREFTEEAAKVLVGNGIPVYVFGDIAPTPLLSFAVRHWKTGAGIVITASHNPPEYNGFKCYQEDGVQMLPEQANRISEVMGSLDLADVSIHEDAKHSPLWTTLGTETNEAYFSALKALFPAQAEHDLSLKVLYTPLHGTGGAYVPEVLTRAGFTTVDTVPEQMVPDGEFPTVKLPNPEEPDAFKLAFAQAGNGGFDLILATDPDGDRVGSAVWHEGSYQLLNGNQVGILMSDYLLQTLPEQRIKNGVIIKTIVSTEMIRPIAAEHDVEVLDTLTGFKYIGDQMGRLEQEDRPYILGFEESYGYLAGMFVRDKDAVMAALLLAQMAAYYRSQGRTLIDQLERLMEKHGFFLEALRSYSFNSSAEAEKAKQLIETLRTNTMTEIAGETLAYRRDYGRSVELHVPSGEETPITLPKEEVIQWETQSGQRITLRPSGTEPKMKLYIGARGSTRTEAEEKRSALEAAFDDIVAQGLAGQ